MLKEIGKIKCKAITITTYASKESMIIERNSDIGFIVIWQPMPASTLKARGISSSPLEIHYHPLCQYRRNLKHNVHTVAPYQV